MTPFERRLPQLNQFVDAMFSNRTPEWNEFMATGNFGDKGYNSLMMALHTCTHDSMMSIMKQLVIMCGWTELLTPPEETPVQVGHLTMTYIINNLTEEVEEYFNGKFMNIIDFEHPSHHDVSGRVSWKHRGIAQQVITQHVRKFAIDDILIDLENEEI